MTNKKIGSALLAFLVCGMVQAASYTAGDTNFRDASPSYRPTKPVPYEDSYHIAGVTWGNTDRAIASENEREPSSDENFKETPAEPKPWLHKQQEDREMY